MPEGNVEIIRRLYGAVNGSGLDAIVAFAHPDVEVAPPPEWTESKVRRGLGPVQEMAREWVEAFDDFTVEPERFLAAGEDRVVVYVRDRGRIKRSDTVIDARLVHVWTLAQGRVLRWEVFTDEARALEAAGLSATDS